MNWPSLGPRWRAAVALLVVFAAGLAGGAMVEDLVDDLDRRVFADRDEGDDELSEEAILAGLDLSPEQRASIEQVFERREDLLESYWDAQLPDLEALMDSTRAEIQGILTPAQRSIYDNQLARLRQSVRQQLREDFHD